MRLRKTIVLLAAAFLFSCESLEHHPDLLGVRLSATRDAAHARLEALGRLARSEGSRQEAWELRDPRFASAMVGYSAEGRVRFITLNARPDAKVRYGDFVDVATAQHRSDARNHRYTSKRGEYEVVAIGSDPSYLTYVTLRRIGEREEEDD